MYTFNLYVTGTFTIPPLPPLVGVPLITQKREKLQPWYFVTFNNFSLDTFVPNLVSLTQLSLYILGKTQTRVFPISGFLVKPL